VQPAVDRDRTLALTWERVDETSVVLQLRGELDLFTVQELQDQANGLAAEGVCRFLIDLSHVSFIDSAGISTIVWFFKRFRDTGSVCLIRPKPACRTALDLVQLPRIVPIYPSVETALVETARGRTA
jgi:anti-sigma B factor antagonist